MQDPIPTVPQPGQPVIPPKEPFFRRLAPVPFAFLSLVIIFFLYQIVGGVLTLILFGTTVPAKVDAGQPLRFSVSEENIQLMRMATMVGQVLFVLVPTLLLIRFRKEKVVPYLRLAIPDYREIILTVIAVFALQQVLQGYMALQDAIPLPSPLQQIIDQFKIAFEETYRVLVTARSPGEFIFVVCVAALTPAICEELLFRGLVQRSFEKVTVGVQGAIITGVIFAAFHLVPYSFVPLAALGSFFGFIVYRSQNISVAISTHFFNNFVACTAAYLQLDDDFVAIAPHRAPTGSLMFLNTIVFGVVFLLATYYFVRVTESVTHPQE